jgi:hypothetical protein
MSSDSMGISTFGEETQESSNYINFRDWCVTSIHKILIKD